MKCLKPSWLYHAPCLRLPSSSMPMMDNFVEGLCANQKSTSTVATTPKQNTAGTDMWESYRRSLQYDILVLLGWVEPPEHEEMEHQWARQKYYNSSHNGAHYALRFSVSRLQSRCLLFRFQRVLIIHHRLMLRVKAKKI
jgi:hypothetical protein